jgi:hypothetical protein
MSVESFAAILPFLIAGYYSLLLSVAGFLCIRQCIFSCRAPEKGIGKTASNLYAFIFVATLGTTVYK